MRKANPEKQAEKANAETEQFNKFLETAKEYKIEEARLTLHENAGKIAELENWNKAIRVVFPSFTELRKVETAQNQISRAVAKLKSAGFSAADIAKLAGN